MYEISEDVYSKEAHEALNALKIKMDNSISDVLGRYHELIKRSIFLTAVNTTFRISSSKSLRVLERP